MSEFFYQDPSAPAPERLHLGTAAALFRGKRLLLDHRRDGWWALFGGAMKLGESVEECLRRELREELGIEVGSLTLVGVFSDPSRIIRFSSGKVVQSVTVAFAADWDEGDFRLSDESRNAKWFLPDEIDPQTLAPTHRMILPFLFRREIRPVIR